MSNKPDIKIITTDDGSHSLYVAHLNETYHSFHGAIQESLHVFIKHGLDAYTQNKKQKTYSIFEVGLGTGLNALLTADYSEKNNLHIEMTSIEAFPLSPEVTDHLNYGQHIKNEKGKDWLKLIHNTPWAITEPIHPQFLLKKIEDKLENFPLEDEAFDVVYFDAFAPNKQEEMWSYTILEKVSRSIKPQGIFVTYCAKGQLKRDLAQLGFQVNTLPGPPGKKEMIQAVKV